MTRLTSALGALASAVLLLAPGTGWAATASFATPAFDKWMYPHVEGGQATQAPIFATLGSSDEDRFSSLLLSFHTGSLITAGLGPGSYAITSVNLRLTVLSGDTFLYDGTSDSLGTYYPSGSPGALPDADAGRPVELFGVGLRHGFTRLSGGLTGASIYGENSPFGTTGATPFRNAFPLGVSSGGALFDASDNVSQQLEALPFAVGTAPLAPGASVPEGTTFTFDLQLSTATIREYVQAGLHAGVLGFHVSSLHAAAGQGGPLTYPRFLTEEGAAFLGAPEYAPQLEITYTVIPEPSALTQVLLGVALLAAGRAWPRRRHLS